MKIRRDAARKLLPLCIVFRPFDNKFVDMVGELIRAGQLKHKDAEWLIVNFYNTEESFLKVLTDLERSIYD